MRGIIFLLIALLLCANPAQAENTVDLPEGWGPIGNSLESYELDVVPEAGIDGSGMRVRSLEGTSNTFGGIAQSIAADEYLGQRVRLSGHLRAIDVSGWSGLWMRVDGSGNGKMLAFDNMNDRAVRGNVDWARYEVVLDVPEEAGRIVFGALLAGNGEIHVDDMNLESVGDDVPVTAEPTPRQPRNMSF